MCGICGIVSRRRVSDDETAAVRKINKALEHRGPDDEGWYVDKEASAYVTTIGQLNPTELSSGQVFALKNKTAQPISEPLHRPVHMVVDDLNNDGNDELVVSEFGNLTGKLSLLVKKR